MPTFKHQDGFSLAEMLVATAIGAFGLVAVAAMIGYGIQLQGNARGASVGVNLAVAELERLRTLPVSSAERSNGGSLTANVANHWALRGQTTVRWVVADGPACGPNTFGGPVPVIECAKNITVSAFPPNALAARSTVRGMLWR
jgi:prepilin-type N-terminal cleavage/methylation domain-containing protein